MMWVWLHFGVIRGEMPGDNYTILIHYETNQTTDYVKQCIIVLPSFINSYLTGTMSAYLQHIRNYYTTEQYNTLINSLTELYFTPTQTLQLAEWHIYGSSRVGIYKANKPLALVVDSTITSYTYQTRVKFRYNGKKQYELSNHLGNVLVTISDRRTAVCNNEDSTLSYNAVVITASDYYSFGSPLIGRSYTADTLNGYRFSFNGKEKTDEINGDGNEIDFGARIVDTRLGRWLSVDPLTRMYPQWSAYTYGTCNPIYFIDKDGRAIIPTAEFKKSNYRPVLDLLVSQGNTEFMKLYKMFDDKTDPNLNLDYKNLTVDGEATTSVSGGAYFIDFNRKTMEIPSDKESFKSQKLIRFDHLTDASMVINTTHEFIHAKMRTEGLSPDKDHEKMATEYRSTIVAVLTEFNQKNRLGLTSKDIANLSWTGLQNTEAFKKEFGEIDFDKLRKDKNHEYYNTLDEKQKGFVTSMEKGKYGVWRDKDGKKPIAARMYSIIKHKYEAKRSVNK